MCARLYIEKEKIFLRGIKEDLNQWRGMKERELTISFKTLISHVPMCMD